MTKPTKWTRRRKALLATPMVLFALYLLIGFFAVGPIVKHFVLPRVSEQSINGNVTAEAIYFNPLNLSARVEQLSVTDAQGNTVIAVGEARANVQIESLWSDQYVLTELIVDQPEVKIAIDESGIMNLSRLAKPTQDEETGEGITPISIGKLALNGGIIEYVDQSQGKDFRHALREMTFTVSDFTTKPLTENKLKFSARTPEGEEMQFEGILQFEPLVSKGTLTFSSIKTAFYSQYYEQLSDLDVSEGDLDIHFEYDFQPLAEPPVLKLSSNSIALSKLTVGDKDAEEPFYQTDSLKVSDIQVDLVNRRFTIGDIAVGKGSLTAKRQKDGKLEIVQALGPLAETSKAKAEAERTLADSQVPQAATDATSAAVEKIIADAAEVWEVKIEKVSIADHDVRWVDQSLGKQATISMSQINFTAGPISSEDGFVVPMTFDAVAGKEAAISIDGQLAPMDETITAAIKLEQFDAAPLAPYADAFAQLDLESGTLSLDGKAKASFKVDQPIETLYDGHIGFANVSIAQNNSAKATAKAKSLNIDGNIKARLANDNTLETYFDGKVAGSELAVTEPTNIAAEGSIAKLDVTGKGKAVVHPSAEPQFDLTSHITLTDVRWRQQQGTPLDSKLDLLQADELVVKSNPLRVQLNELNLTQPGMIVERGTRPSLLVSNVLLQGIDYVGDPVGITLTKVRLDGTTLAEAENQKQVASLGAVQLSDASFELAPTNIRASLLTVEKPQFELGVDSEGNLNIAPLLAAFSTGEAEPASDSISDETATSEAPPTKSASFNFDVITISEGQGKVYDDQTAPGVPITFEKLNLQLEKVSSDPETKTVLDFTGLINSASTVSLAGTLNAANPLTYSDLKLKADNFVIKDYELLAGPYLGHEITSGNLYIVSETKLADGSIDAKNTFTLKTFHLGKKVDSEKSIKAPIKLAMDILRDREDQIILTIPVTATISDPQFDLSQTITQAITNVIAGIATAPFDILSTSIDSIAGLALGKVDLSFVAFEPGSDVLSEKAQKKLEAIAKAMKKRPAISIVLQSDVSPQYDLLQLKRQAVLHALAEARLENTGMKTELPHGEITPDTPIYSRRIEDLYEELTDAPAIAEDDEQRFMKMEEQVLAGFLITDEHYADLAKRRIEAVQVYLIEKGELKPERVTQGEPNMSAEAEKARVKFGVQQMQ